MIEEAQQGRAVSDSLAVEHMLTISPPGTDYLQRPNGMAGKRSLAFRAARALDDQSNEETREDQSAHAGSYEPEQKSGQS
jgi:hypothetical protein